MAPARRQEPGHGRVRRGGKPIRVHTVVVSTQHADEIGSRSVSNEEIRQGIIEKIIRPVVPARYSDQDTVYHINPTGRFVIGGPHGDSGLTGRKIIVDTYGGKGSHGGGAFSGKDPSKVDRSAAYMAATSRRTSWRRAWRTSAKSRSPTPSAWPTRSASASTPAARARSPTLASRKSSARPSPSSRSEMIEYLNLLRPIYRKTAEGGHFGRELPEFTWEELRKVDELKQAARNCK